MRILIVGGGKVAEELIKYIDPRRNQIYIVEKDPERRQELMSKYDVYIIGKDATDVSLYISDVKMDQIDAVFALTGSDEINLLVSAIAKMYNVPYRFARVNEHKIAELMRELGLCIPFTQPSIIASLAKNYIFATVSSMELTSFTIGNETYYVLILAVNETDATVGKTIEELEHYALQQGVKLKVLMIFDGEELKQPDPSDELKPGYQLLLLSSIRDVERIIKG